MAGGERKRRKASPGAAASLATTKQELCLDFTLPTGQSFRWRRTGENEYTGVVANRLVPPPPPPPPPFPAKCPPLLSVHASVAACRADTIDISSCAQPTSVCF